MTTVQYTLDDLPAQFQTLPQVSSNTHNVSFFVSPPLAAQQHTLVAVLTSVGPTYFFDYLTYRSAVDTTAPSPPSSSTSCTLPSPSPSACPAQDPQPSTSGCPAHTDAHPTVLTAALSSVCALLVVAVIVQG